MQPMQQMQQMQAPQARDLLKSYVCPEWIASPRFGGMIQDVKIQVFRHEKL